MDIRRIVQKLEAAGQSHLLQFWDNLSPEEQGDLMQDLESMDLAEINGFFAAAMVSSQASGEKVDSRMEPVPKDVLGSTTRDRDQLKAWEEEGELPLKSESLLAHDQSRWNFLSA